MKKSDKLERSLSECEREELLKEKVCRHSSDTVAVEHGIIHFWIRDMDAHATDKMNQKSSSVCHLSKC